MRKIVIYDFAKNKDVAAFVWDEVGRMDKKMRRFGFCIGVALLMFDHEMYVKNKALKKELFDLKQEVNELKADTKPHSGRFAWGSGKEGESE